MDEDAVNITRHKHILEDIRHGDTTDDSSGGHQRDREESVSGDQERVEGRVRGLAGGTQGNGESNGVASGLREGVRQTQPKNVNPTARPRVRKPKESSGVEEKPAPTRLRLPFLEKNQTKKTPVKLFSLEEAEAEQERMAEIYSKLFDFGDDVLEIIVRDHESVEIWHITDEQAETLARNHLNQARTNVEAARSARKLLEIYDRLYFYSVMIPRVVKTSNHIAEHKGVSFK